MKQKKNCLLLDVQDEYRLYGNNHLGSTANMELDQ
jgi:hypothetical protein